MKKENIGKSLLRLVCFVAVFACISVLSAPVTFAKSFVLNWLPNAEPDLAGYRIYYKAASAQYPFDGVDAVEGVAPIDVSTQTSATLTGLDPGTDYYFAITAYNTSGTESPYSTTIKVAGVTDVTPPKVTLSLPVGSSTVSGDVAVTATATDDIGVTRIEIYENGSLLTAGNTSPFTYTWHTGSLTNGNHTLTAQAYDAAGNSSIASTTVNVQNDSTPPAITFLAPTASYVYGNSVTVSASATDDVKVAKMDLYIDGTFTTSTTSSTFSVPVNFTKGVHVLTVKATDSSNNVGTKSLTINRFF